VNAAVLMFSACLAGADPMPVAMPVQVAPPPVVAYGGDNCGKATVCGDCDTGHKCCLFSKIRGKLFCCDKGNKCGNECAPPKPVCCPKPAPVCCKVKAEPTCNTCGTSKGCGFLSKCKGKLSCGKGNECCGGVATAATPGACGSAVVPPPPPTAPVAPPPPPLKDMPRKVGSGYNPIHRNDLDGVSPVLPATPASSPKPLELGPTPF
jgi:hypothetical protein